MKNKLTKDTTRLINEFIDAVTLGFEAWQHAGEIMVNLVNINSDIVPMIVKQCPNITEEMCKVFYRIGKKQIYPKVLLYDNAPGCDKLLELPYEKQAEYIEKPVPLVIRNGNGRYAIQEKPVQELNKKEANQVFSSLRVRTKDEQIQIIEQKEVKNTLPKWEVKDGKLMVRAKTIISKSEILEILKQMGVNRA